MPNPISSAMASPASSGPPQMQQAPQNPMMQQMQAGQPQAPQISPGQAADFRLKMGVTGQAIQALMADPKAGPKQAIQIIGGIIANNPDHFDANWGAGILSDMPADPTKFRPWLMRHAQMQAQAHQVLDQMHPQQPQQMAAGGPPQSQEPQIDPALLGHVAAHRSAIEPLLHKSDLSAKDIAHHLGVDAKDLPKDKDALRDLLAAHYVHTAGHEAVLHDAIGGDR